MDGSARAHDTSIAKVYPEKPLLSRILSVPFCARRLAGRPESGQSGHHMTRTRRKPWSRERLERSAFHYLSRYASTRARLRDVLERKIRRSRNWVELSEEEAGWITEIADKCEQMGLIDDREFASVKARSLHRAGKSTKAIRSWLRGRGVDEARIDAAIDELAEEGGLDRRDDVDASAALRFARKRRLGPFRREALASGPEGLKARQRELAALARAGFGIGIAHAITEADSPEDLQQRLQHIIERGIAD